MEKASFRVCSPTEAGEFPVQKEAQDCKARLEKETGQPFSVVEVQRGVADVEMMTNYVVTLTKNAARFR